MSPFRHQGRRGAMSAGSTQRPDLGTRPAAAASWVMGGQDELGFWARQQRALYEELRDTYERVCVLAGEGHYNRLAEEVGKTQTLVDDVRRVASAVEPARSVTTRESGPGERSRAVWSDMERLLTDLLRTRERALEALGAAAEETQSALARLSHSHAALGRYRIPRSTSPRLQSCRA